MKKYILKRGNGEVIEGYYSWDMKGASMFRSGYRAALIRAYKLLSKDVYSVKTLLKLNSLLEGKEFDVSIEEEEEK